MLTGLSRLEKVLMWALGLSWVPFAITALIAAAYREYMWSIGIEFVGVLWVLKLCDIFDLLEREDHATTPR